MKISHQQLENHLAKSLAPIYLISGDELLLVQESADAIRSTAKKQGFTERVRIPIESGTEWSKQLFLHAQSISIFEEKKILELDLRAAKITKAFDEIFQNYAERIPSNTLLLISIHKLDQKTEKSAWYKAIEKVGVTLPIWPIAPEQLPQWILQRAKKLDLTFTLQTAAQLADQVEGNLLAAAQEIEKLKLLQPSGTIDQATLESCMVDNAHFDIFILVDSMLLGNTKRSLRILKNLIAEDTESTLILWAMTRELRMLAAMSLKISQGAQLAGLFSEWRVWEKRQAGVRHFLKRHTTEKCWEFLLAAGKIDRMIKGAEKGNVQDELERLVVLV